MRSRRLKARRQLNPRTAKANPWYGPPSPLGPVVRGRVNDSVVPPMPMESRTWHQNRVEALFRELDVKDTGVLNMELLRASFGRLKIPLDSAAFQRYCDEVLGESSDGEVRSSTFMKLHAVVWANQPPAVRRFAGDPNAFPTGTKLSRSLSSASPFEARQSEHVARRAFQRVAGPDGLLRASDLPSLLRDLGLEPLTEEPELPQGKEALTFHEFVEQMNALIAELERAALRAPRIPPLRRDMGGGGARFSAPRKPPSSGPELLVSEAEAEAAAAEEPGKDQEDEESGEEEAEAIRKAQKSLQNLLQSDSEDEEQPEDTDVKVETPPQD